MNIYNLDEDGCGPLGIPTELEMWRHTVTLLTGENHESAREITTARRNLVKLAAMYAKALDDNARLEHEVKRLTWDISNHNLTDSQKAVLSLNAFSMAYASTPNPAKHP